MNREPLRTIYTDVFVEVIFIIGRLRDRLRSNNGRSRRLTVTADVHLI